MKKALITGIKGQDGSYLTEFLLNKGYEVYGIIRKSDAEDPILNCPNIKNLLSKIKLYGCNLEDYEEVLKVLEEVKPDECYHFAAQSFVDTRSPEEAAGTIKSNINSTYVLIWSILKMVPKCKFYFSGTSEMFGNALESPQKESTPFRPRSPYGISKLAGYHFMRMERDKGFFGCAGLAFNHESPRRKSIFVTKKITDAVARISNGSKEILKMGNIESYRDWGYAGDYVEAMWLMLQQEKPYDYVIGTGEKHTVREFLEEAFGKVGLDWKNHVEIDPSLLRGEEETLLCADFERARKVLGWNPKTKFKDLVALMVDSSLKG